MSRRERSARRQRNTGQVVSEENTQLMSQEQIEESTGKHLAPVQKNTPVIVPQNLAAMMVQDAKNNSGFENMTTEDIALPYLTILQSGSPQVKRSDPEYIEGAQEGDFYNNVTKTVYQAPIWLVPCFYQKAYPEFVLRAHGGGFVATHTDSKILETCIKDEDGRMITPKGDTQIQTTAYHYCLLVTGDNEYERVVLPLPSTQLKKSRRWNSQQMNISIVHGGKKFTPPIYSHMYKAVTVPESNDKGSWMSIDFQGAEALKSPEIYGDAKKFHDDVKKNLVKIAPPPSEDIQQQDTSNHF